MNSSFVLASTLILLTGCGVERALERMDASEDRNQCLGFGFVPDTDAFSNCLMQQSAQRAELDQRIQYRMERDDGAGRWRRR